MIARIVTGSGRSRQTFALPCSTVRKDHVEARIGVGNVLKGLLWPKGQGFKQAKARGLAAAGVSA